MAEKKEKRYMIENAQLMAEWDWDENEKHGLYPTKLTFGSGKKVHWVCSIGHKWETSIYDRVKKGYNCPFCSNKRILPGYNDLQSQRPDLMSEWDYDENTIDPSTIAAKSNKVASWICPKGHKYSKAIYKRASGEECPTCAYARRTSFPEQCFYYYIKKYYPDAINGYREIFVNSMELDIYIPSIKTGIEYDGFFYHKKDLLFREEKKYLACRQKGIRLFRIKEGNFSGFTNVADKIWYIPKKCNYQTLDYYIEDFLKHLTFWGINLPDVNVARDKFKILEYRTLKLQDSLLFLHPKIAQEWHPSKNGKLTPDLFVPGSAERVWWLCSECGNEWASSIVNRTKGHGCDVCATAKRKVTKKDTILSKRGTIDKEWCLLDWDYEENEHGPNEYTNGSGEVVGWKCHTCGHKWKAAICDRTRDYKNGCPLCSGKTIVKGVNDLPTVLPELMLEWDYKSNTEADPTKVGKGSHLIVSWICRKCGYKWDAQIYNRANGKGCPCCANRVIVPGINDLSTTNPLLTQEWHPTKNGDLMPTHVSKGQSKKVWWLCRFCGNEWEDTLNHRSSQKRGCPKCAREKRKKN